MNLKYHELFLSRTTSVGSAREENAVHIELSRAARSLRLPETFGLHFILKTPANDVFIKCHVPKLSWSESGSRILDFTVESL